MISLFGTMGEIVSWDSMTVQTLNTLTDTPISSRPANANGTSKWETIFEDPDRGILPVVAASRSPGQLRKTISRVAELLFKRKRDAESRAAFEEKLHRLLDVDSAEEFEQARALILGILNAEKNTRIEKAEKFAQNKSAAQSIERRRSKATGIGSRNSRLLMIGSSAIAGLALITLLGTFMLGGDGGDDLDVAAGSDEFKQMSVASADQTVAPTAKETSPPPDRLRAMLALKPLNMRIPGHSGQQRIALLPLIKASKGIDEDDRDPICNIAPRIIESINIHAHAAVSAQKEIDAGLLAEIARKARGEIKKGGYDVGTILLRDVRQLPRNALSAARHGCGRVMLDADL